MTIGHSVATSSDQPSGSPATASTTESTRIPTMIAASIRWNPSMARNSTDHMTK